MSRSIFAARNVAVLHRAAATNVLVVLDFDGTLAPIVDRPAAARLRPRTRALLERVAERYPTVVLTGRARADVAKRLRGIPLAAIVGNHGLEVGGRRAEVRGIVRRWVRSLESRTWLPGILVEDKRESVAIHYRGATARAGARRQILSVSRRLIPPPHIVPGKAVVNLLPDVGVNKGTAILDLMREHEVQGAIFVGDDVTDEDVFALPASARILTIRIGRSASSRAKYHLATQAHIDALLALLADERGRR